MIELKTLKNIELETICIWAKNEKTRKLVMEAQSKIYNKIRAEAIKWVKEKREVKMYVCEMDFMDFFNITEEDLKESEGE